MVDTNLDYENMDISRANHVMPNVIKTYQTNKSQSQNNASPIDDDVMDWLVKQDDATKHHINEVIRHFMAIKHV